MMAGLYLSVMVRNTLPLDGSFWPPAMAALAYALANVRSMPMTSPVERISGPSSVSAPAPAGRRPLGAREAASPARAGQRPASSVESLSKSSCRHDGESLCRRDIHLARHLCTMAAETTLCAYRYLQQCALF